MENTKAKKLILVIGIILVITVVILIVIISKNKINNEGKENQEIEKTNTLFNEMAIKKDLETAFENINWFHKMDNTSLVWRVKINTTKSGIKTFVKDGIFNLDYGTYSGVSLFADKKIGIAFYNRNLEENKIIEYTYKGYKILNDTESYVLELYKPIESNYCCNIVIDKSDKEEKITKEYIYNLIDSIELERYHENFFKDTVYLNKSGEIYPSEDIYLNTNVVNVENSFEIDLTNFSIKNFVNKEYIDYEFEKYAKYGIRLLKKEGYVEYTICCFEDNFDELEKYIKENTYGLNDNYDYVSDDEKPCDYEINGIKFKKYTETASGMKHLVYENQNKKYVITTSPKSLEYLRNIILNLNKLEDSTENIESNEQKNEAINEQENKVIVNETQMLNWDTIQVRGKGLQDSGDWYASELVNSFSANMNSKASVVMKKYPNSTYESTVYFSALDDSGKASSLTGVKMHYNKEKDVISSFDFDIYTANEFYINNIQLAGLKKDKVKEKLGEPYAIVDGVYIYRYNDGYIIISFLIKTRNIDIIKNGYIKEVVKDWSDGELKDWLNNL